MDTQRLMTFIRSRVFAGIVTGIGIMLILMIVFQAGVTVGFHEAQFSSRWGENYGRNFGGPMSGSGFDELMPNGHGAIGKIISVASTTLMISNGAKPEVLIKIQPDTKIRQNENTLTANDLKAGMNVIVLGNPDSTGAIDASLIRVVPAMPMMKMMATTTP